jgi:hypothetical protein
MLCFNLNDYGVAGSSFHTLVVVFFFSHHHKPHAWRERLFSFVAATGGSCVVAEKEGQTDVPLVSFV